MDTNNLISFCLPLYNEEKNIDILIPSILKQTHTHIEIIIINNGSTDKTAEKIEPYLSKDSRIKLISLSKNRGSSWSFKHLISVAQGKYFAWIAGDMQLQPNFAKRLAKELDRDQTIVTAYSHVNIIGSYKETRSDQFSLMHESAIDRIKSLYLYLNLGTIVNGLHRTEVLKELFISPPSGFMPIWSSSRHFNFGDLQLLTFLLLKGKIKQVGIPLINRDCRENLKLKTHINTLARNEGYFCHRRSNIGLPSYNGIHEILSRLYQSDLTTSELIDLNRFILYVIKERFALLLKTEVRELLIHLSQRNISKAWSNKYSLANENEAAHNPQILRFFLYEIIADIQLALMYSDEEELLVAKQLCEQFLKEAK